MSTPVRPRAVAALTALVAALAPARARAFDAEVRSDSYAQIYQLHGPTGAPVVSSLRVTEALSLALVDRPVDRHGVTVIFRARLRLDSDFGGACDAATPRCFTEGDRTRPGEFQPLFASRAIDVQYAYVDVLNVARGTLDLRVGRIFQVDPLGFFLYDGGRARVHLASFAVAEALAGLETRAGFPLSNGRFERDGLVRADRGAWDPTLAPYVLEPELAPTLGVSLETAHLEPVYARVSYRRVWTDGNLAEEKVGGEIDARIAHGFRLFGNVVYSIPDRVLGNALASLEWSHPSGVRAAIEFSRYRPTFDLSSIWAAFWIDPTDEARARGEIPLGRRLVLTGEWLVRRYALSESGASTNGPPQPDLWNTGGMGSLQLRLPGLTGALRGRAEGGAIGARGGMDADASWWLVPERVRLEARLSAWEIADDLRPERIGPSLGAVAGATIRLGRLADVHLDVEDDSNRIVGHRFRAMSILRLRGPF